MHKDLIVRQKSEIEPVRGKHRAFPSTHGGWFLTGITFVGTAIVCTVSHFDGGTVLGGLFVVGTVSGFSDDVLHVLLYGRRFPEHLASSNRPNFGEAASELVHRLLGFERESDPRNSFKAKMARMLGLPEPDYNDDSHSESKQAGDVIPMGSATEQQAGNDSMVDLAAKLQLDIDDIAGKAIFICGIRRSGKTTLGVRIAEELGRFTLPMLIPCLKGDWLSVASTLPNARVWGQDQVGMKHARAIGWAILERGMQLIFNIASYDDINEACDILAEMVIGLFEWEKAHPEDRRLCAAFLDEAQTLLPKVVGRSIITIPAIRDKLLSVYSRVIAFGGSYGLFPVIMTQRIAEVNKIIVGQPELLFLFKQTLDIDLQRYQEFTDIPTDQVRGLKQGHGIFVDYEGQSSIHKFHKRTSSDAMSSTPRYHPARSQAKPTPAPATRLFDEDDCNDGTEMDPLPTKQAPAAKPTIPEKGPQAEDLDLDVAVAVWNAGHNSVSKLMKIFKLTNHQAQKLRKRILDCADARSDEEAD